MDMSRNIWSLEKQAGGMAITKIHSILSKFSSSTYSHKIVGNEQIINRQLRVSPEPELEIFEARMIYGSLYI